MGRSGTGQPIPGVEAAWGGASAEIGAAMDAPVKVREREMRETENVGIREREDRAWGRARGCCPGGACIMGGLGMRPTE